MIEDDPLMTSPLDTQFRAAHRALLALAPPGTFAAAGDSYLPVIVEDLEDLARLAGDTAAENFGPAYRWQRPEPVDAKWAPVVLQLDLDGYSDEDPPGVSRIQDWECSALARAARAYRRECRWDHSPDEAGIWLLHVMPYESMGATWTGVLAGFAIIHDRDMDGDYESLAHLWVARSWRRRGVGRSLLQEAQARFPLSGAEGPVSDSGRRLLEVCAPDWLR